MTSSRATSFALATFLGAATLVPAAFFAQDPTQEIASFTPPPSEASAFPARLSDVEGSVRIAQHPRVAVSSQAQNPNQAPAPPVDQVFSQAAMNMPVLAGAQIETGGDGRAEMQFNDGSIVRITPNSAVVVLSLESSGEQLYAVRGLSYFEVPDRTLGLMTVQAGPDLVRLAQNSLVRFNLDNPPYQVAVLRGSAHFNDKNGDIGFETTAGSTAVLDPSAPTAYDLKQDIATESWDAWNTDRDSTLAQLAEGETNARVGTGDADSPAWNDLDYYGTWYNVPGAGMAWAPDGVDANFDPYGAGAWGYYSGVGYTWVSSYPWGWLPYHCGTWNHFSGFGWGWQPGGACGGFSGAGWYPYTGVHNAPRDYRLPIMPFDPRLRTHLGGVPMPRPQPLAPVTRGPAFRFRQIGGTRPEPRVFPLDRTAALDSGSNFAPILPVGNLQQRPQYQQPRSTFTGNSGSRLQTQPVQRGNAIYTPGPNVITPPPHVLAAPRMAVPPPVHITPPPVIAAPRFSAPAAAPAPRAR